MGWIVLDPRRLAANMDINEIAGDQVVVGETLRVAQRQRRIQHGTAERPPNVDDAEPVLEQLFSVGSQVVAYAPA